MTQQARKNSQEQRQKSQSMIQNLVHLDRVWGAGVLQEGVLSEGYGDAKLLRFVIKMEGLQDVIHWADIGKPHPLSPWHSALLGRRPAGECEKRVV